jgi:hypothetical protein
MTHNAFHEKAGKAFNPERTKTNFSGFPTNQNLRSIPLENGDKQ